MRKNKEQAANSVVRINFRYKTMSGSSNYHFSVLTKIVKHMRARHLEGDDHPLTLDDILDETNQLDIRSSMKTVSYLEAAHYSSFSVQCNIFFF